MIDERPEDAAEQDSDDSRHGLTARLVAVASVGSLASAVIGIVAASAPIACATFVLLVMVALLHQRLWPFPHAHGLSSPRPSR